MADHDTHDHTGVPGVGSGNTVATDTIWDAAGDLVQGTGADTAAKLTKGAAGTVLVSGSSNLSWIDVLPWHILVLPTVMVPDATTGTWANATSTQQSTFPFYAPGSAANSGSGVFLQNSSGTAQNDAVAWDLILAAGTWNCRVIGRKHSASAIVTLQQDGSDMGTTDFYDAAGALGDGTISGWTVSTTGKHRMNLKAATKNASSSNYFLTLAAIEFRRTA
jgi:hypothetical protein